MNQGCNFRVGYSIKSKSGTALAFYAVFYYNGHDFDAGRMAHFRGRLFSLLSISNSSRAAETEKPYICKSAAIEP